jgi:hypothetical protein
LKKLLLVAVCASFLFACMTGPEIPKDAVKLGERTVAFTGSQDIIQVGNYEGSFRSLFFVVRDNDIQIRDLVVTYGNGQKESFDTRLDFSADSRSRSLPLEGGKRRIRNLAFTYKTVGSWLDGRATVVVYGIR